MHQPLARGAAGHVPRPRRRSSACASSLAGERRAADERELDQQLQPHLAVGVRQRLQDAAQDRDGFGAAAAGARSRLARWRAASTRRDASAARCATRASTRAPSSSPASSKDRPRSKSTASTSCGAGGSASARSSSRAAVVEGAEPPRRVGGTAQRRHDLGVTARRRAHQVLGDALVVDAVVGEQRGRARMQLGRVQLAPIASRAAAATSGCAKPYASASSTRSTRSSSSAAIASLALEPGERARPALVGVGPQHGDGARERGRGRRQPLEPIADEPHELRRRAAVAHRVHAAHARACSSSREIQRVAAGRARAPARRAATDSGPAEHRLDQARGAGHRERRRLQPHERALGGQHGDAR